MAVLVSCIMPTRNRRAFVPQAIRYFQRQDYPDRELVVLDDGSDAIRDLIPPDPKIRYVRLDLRHRLGTKRNLACQRADGTVILHWDDDDWMASWRISYQVVCLLKSRADICGLDRLYLYQPATHRAWQYVHRGKRPWVAGGTLCYTKSFWQRNPFPDVRVGEDNRFVLSNQPKKVLILRDSTFYVALMHPHNTSPKQPRSKSWQPHSASEISALMREDWAFYAGLPPTRGAHLAQRPETDVSRPASTELGPDMGRVTVPITYYQCKPYVRQAVESILDQTYTDLRVVVVNDGDRDPPWDELAHIDDPRLIRFDLDANYGTYFAHAVVLAATNDPYFAIQDADDWSEPQRIAFLLRKLYEQGTDGVLSAAYCVRMVGNRTARYSYNSFPGRGKPLTAEFRHRASHHGLFRAESLRRIGGYYGGFRVYYDSLITNLLLLTGRLAYVGKPLYNWRRWPGSQTQSKGTGFGSRVHQEEKRQLSQIYRQAYEQYKAYVAGMIDVETLSQRIRQACAAHISQQHSEALRREAKRLRNILNVSG